ncbi:MAG TPA: ABC transporter permease [Candidatus Limnocylindrales bacterium]|nr:ABC transporter permease [Candidatus Limnocylindrales bacterium]
MQAWLQDLRYALRMLRKSPGLTLIMIASLAVGIGANSAIFSVVDALLLRPLPYPQPDRLAAIWLHSPGIGIFRDWPSPGQYIDLRSENHSFSDMALAQSRVVTLTGRERPERIGVMRTQSSLLRMLGAKPILGRLLQPDEDMAGKPPVAILTEQVWRRLFSADPNIVGKSVMLNGRQYTVAGVLDKSFMLNAEVMPSEGPLESVDAILPLPLAKDAVNARGDENYNIVVKLKPGVTLQQAQADVSVIADRIRIKDKRDRTYGMHVVGLQDEVVGDVRRAVLVLLGSVSLVLLIACANVANLLLTRAAARQKEVAIRTALGAGLQRLARQLLTESIVLGLAGGAAGVVIAELALYVVRTINPGNIPRLDDIGMNAAVLVFTFGVSLLTGILFGLAPVSRAVKVDLNTSLKSGGRSGQSEGGLGVGKQRLRGLLVVAEFALSLVLLIGAGLLIRSFVRLEKVPPGFNPQGVLSMQVSATGPKYAKPTDRNNFMEEIHRRIAALPGVQAVGMVSSLPLTGSVGWGGIKVEGYQPPPGQELQVDIRTASDDYFRAMEIPIVDGRAFSDRDTLDGPQVAIIDAKFARRFWPQESPVGKHVWFDPKKPMTIVGVAGVVKQYGLETDGKVAVYFPMRQAGDSAAFLVAKTEGEPASLSRAIVGQVHAVDSDAVVYNIRTMDQRVHDSLARQRFASIMLTAFAGFALLLAAIGIYGVMSYLVAQGTHDIGLRVALGARAADIIAMVVRQGMELAAAGIGIGIAAGLALTRVMASLLFGVSPTDAVTFTAVAGILAFVGLAATVIPARRATRVDPIVALREE